jgi:hypothetical protein
MLISIVIFMLNGFSRRIAALEYVTWELILCEAMTPERSKSSGDHEVHEVLWKN